MSGRNESIDRINNGNNEAMIYGIASFGWDEKLMNYLKNLGMQYYQFDSVGFDHIKTNKVGTKRLCKKTLTSLIIKNFEREKKGLPLIPLIFITADQNNTVDVKKVAQSRDGITDSELRRCYKIFSHSGHPSVRDLAARTFKFVKLSQNNGEYNLEEIPPFWTNADWAQAWESRSHSETKTNSDWRDQLDKCITEIMLKDPSIYPVVIKLQKYSKGLQSSDKFDDKASLTAIDNLIKRILGLSSNPLTESELSLLVKSDSMLATILFGCHDKSIFPEEVRNKISIELENYLMNKIVTFHDAVVSNNVHLLRELILSHPEDINSRDIDGRTPLLLAIQEKRFDIIQELLTCPDLKFDDELKKIITEIYLKDNRIVSLFLNDKRFDNSNYDLSALLLAAIAKNDLMLVTELLSRNDVDVNYSSSRLDLPLNIAINNNLPDMVALILKYKADAFIVSNKKGNNINPIQNALKNESNLIYPLVAMFKDTNDSNLYNKDHYDLVIDHLNTADLTKLFKIAFKNQDFELMHKLIETRKVDINKNIDGILPLTNAIKSKNAPMIEFLLKHGANLLNEKEVSPLAYVSEDFPVQPSLLIKYLKDINMKDAKGNAAIHYAAEANNTQLLTELLAQPDIDLESLNRDEEDILSILVNKIDSSESEQNSRQECITILLKKLPYRPENETTHDHLYNLLIFGLKNPDKPYQSEIVDNVINLFKTYPEVLNHKEQTGKYKSLTFLHIAAYLSNVQAVKSLLEAGADPNIRVGNDINFISWLLKNKSADPAMPQILELLLQHNANVATAQEQLDNTQSEEIKKIWAKYKPKSEVEIDSIHTEPVINQTPTETIVQARSMSQVNIEIPTNTSSQEPKDPKTWLQANKPVNANTRNGMLFFGPKPVSNENEVTKPKSKAQQMKDQMKNKIDHFTEYFRKRS